VHILVTLLACSFAPSVAPGPMGLRDFTLQGTTLDAGLQVHNPWPAQGVVDATWSFTLGGTPLSQGTVHGLAIAPSTDTVLTVPIHLRWADLVAASSSLGDEVPYRVSAELRGHTILGQWTVPVDLEGTLPGLRWPELVWVDWRIDEINTQRAAATLIVDVQHLPIASFVWGIDVGTAPLAHGRIARAENRTELPVVVEVGRGLEALQTVAVAGLALRAEGALVSPLGPIPVHLERAWRPE
jgi:hypothetical protein